MGVIAGVVKCKDGTDSNCRYEEVSMGFEHGYGIITEHVDRVGVDGESRQEIKGDKIKEGGGWGERANVKE